jgi:hypothetical protein
VGTGLRNLDTDSITGQIDVQRYRGDLLFNFNVAALAAGGWKRVFRRRRTEISSDRSDTSGASVSPLF